jgi:LDH2 family malate/lactate/ureidoglycolate dehydrogenase
MEEDMGVVIIITAILAVDMGVVVAMAHPNQKVRRKMSHTTMAAVWVTLETIHTINQPSTSTKMQRMINPVQLVRPKSSRRKIHLPSKWKLRSHFKKSQANFLNLERRKKLSLQSHQL